MNRALYAYIPVVHAGVLDMLNTHQGVPLWLLDNEKGKEENVYLERDMRALSAIQIKKELEALGYTNIQIVGHDELSEFTKSIDELLVPNDEIVTYFVDKFAPSVPTRKVSIFLRWTKPISVAEYEVPKDRIISTDELHRKIFGHLEEEAAKSSDWWRQIGAMIIKDGEPIATTHNAHLPTSHSVLIHGDPRSNLDAGQGPGVYTSIHAEAAAIAETARKGLSTEGSDIYVTTFPCPTCARLLVQAGIKNVYYRKGYSLLDAEEILSGAGVQIILVADEVTRPE
jgi:dCMP deaminase